MLKLTQVSIFLEINVTKQSKKWYTANEKQIYIIILIMLYDLVNFAHINHYLFYLILLVLSSISYIIATYTIAKESIVFKLGLFILPSLITLCFTSYCFAITRNFLLFIPALGSLFMTVYVLLLLIRKPIRELENKIAEIAQGNLNIRIDKKIISQRNEFGLIGTNISMMSEKLTNVVHSIMKVLDNLTDSSQNLSTISDQLSEGSNNQASSSEEAASSMEEITSNILQNSDNSLQAERISDKAYGNIVSSVQTAIQAMESMKTITDKIKIINDIADQTNILALNASVEAARAGEQGKGFSVVANEVKKLAQTSKDAAENINHLSDTVIKSLESASNQLNLVTPEMESTTIIIKEISASSNEQKNGAEQINTALQILNQETQNNALTSDKVANTAKQLLTQSKLLKKTIAFFKINSVSQ